MEGAPGIRGRTLIPVDQAAPGTHAVHPDLQFPSHLSTSRAAPLPASIARPKPPHPASIHLRTACEEGEETKRAGQRQGDNQSQNRSRPAHWVQGEPLVSVVRADLVAGGHPSGPRPPQKL